MTYLYNHSCTCVNNQGCLTIDNMGCSFHFMKTIGKRLKAARHQAGMTQRQLSDASGVKQQVISKIETGHQDVTSFAIPLARATGVRPEWLAEGEGPMQTNGTDLGHALPFAKPDHIDIPLMNAGGAMGPGRMAPDQEEIIEKFEVSVAWLRKYVNISNPANLAIITGYGDSMEGTFSDGDLLLVDRSVTSIRIDAVYVLARGDELFIKRLQRLPDGTLLMISDNDRYKPYPITPSDWLSFRVLGRVIIAMAKKIL